MPKQLSGLRWVTKFPTSQSTDDLTEPFRTNCKKFVAAMQAAGANVTIAATLRPPQRAYLMHFSFRIAKELLDPALVPGMDGVDIEWVHRDTRGGVLLSESRDAAAMMVTGFAIVFRPALTSRHSEGNAIDMNVFWTTPELKIKNASGSDVIINSRSKNGSNADLQKVGKSYGVLKLVTDPPHWSNDGR